MRLNTKNMARTTLTKDIGATDTSFTVADANVLPDPPFRMIVENEIMEVGAKNVSTKTLSGVLRGQEGTTATAHANGSIVENRFTAGTYDEIKQTMGPLASLITRIKTSIVNALNGLQEDFNSHKAEEATESEYGHVRLSDLPKGKRVARFVIGTSTAGWTAADCDYLCDGTADQEEIIQALNALPATGGEIVILDGIYNITASINILKDNVSIRGSGNATTLKRRYNSTNTISGPTAKGLITLNGKSGCQIQGLQIDGNKAIHTASYNYGISLSSSSNNTITGNTCNNNNDNSISLTSSNNNTVTGNTCNNNTGHGISLTSSNNNTITGNTCNNTDYGISLSSSSNNTVTDNTCNNYNYGIRTSSSSNNNTVTGNTCNNNNYGIYLTSSNNNTITGNTCNNNHYYGIYLSSSNNNTVTGNTCIRGTGTPEDYLTDQYTIRLSGSNNNYNLISSNNCMGKAVAISGGTGNSAWGNKFDATNDLP